MVVSSGSSEGFMTEFAVLESVPRSISSSLVLLLRLESVSGLSRDLLLESLVLPGGGDEDKFPSNKESCRGGKEVKET